MSCDPGLETRYNVKRSWEECQHEENTLRKVFRWLLQSFYGYEGKWTLSDCVSRVMCHVLGHVMMSCNVAHLTVCGAGHVASVDLYDLVSRLKPPVTGHQAVREHLHRKNTENIFTILISHWEHIYNLNSSPPGPRRSGGACPPRPLWWRRGWRRCGGSPRGTPRPPGWAAAWSLRWRNVRVSLRGQYHQP